MKVVIALGSNLGEPEIILQGAIASLNQLLSVTAVSTFHRTAPVGGPVQPDYLNAVLVGDCTNLSAVELLHQLQAIEAEAGRTREVRWGPRTLDLDLILFGDQVMQTPELTLPHPRAHERKFVLEPWSEIDPDASIPGKGSVQDLLRV